MDTLNYILNKYNLSSDAKSPIEIPNVGRDNLATLFAELGFNKGLELGVERGLFSEILCKANQNLELFSVDAWKAYKGYREHVTQEKVDQIYNDAVRRLSYYNCKVIKGYSMGVVSQFDDNSLDFVYIDGNHDFQNTTNDIVQWSQKVRPGGIIAGHDYTKWQNTGINDVVYVVNAYTQAKAIKPWFLLGRKEKIEGEVRDKSRSYMWVKS
jgi:predicted O-methyltransferase YrrM